MQKQKTKRPRIVRLKKLTVILNLSRARIGQLVKMGLPKKCRGEYDRDECAGWYIEYLKALVGEGGEVIKSEQEERLRLLRANADLREIELARERGQLVLIEDVENEMTDMILVTKARLLAVGARVAPELVDEISRVMIQAVIEKHTTAALSHLEILKAEFLISKAKPASRRW